MNRKMWFKLTAMAVAAVMMMACFAGCGKKEEDNVPSQKSEHCPIIKLVIPSIPLHLPHFSHSPPQSYTFSFW